MIRILICASAVLLLALSQAKPHSHGRGKGHPDQDSVDEHIGNIRDKCPFSPEHLEHIKNLHTHEFDHHNDTHAIDGHTHDEHAHLISKAPSTNNPHCQ
ncbi:uncharacterized protein LOC143027246 isoform X2 [Oratosquilla oratoria]|uniref:uncharacterized protein LOC143027246 isoform X2 n=1 Tax=Oratosquilla oratoria TaxID=337810 RepID=UPI003F763F30